MTDEEWMPENKHELMAVIQREWGLLIDVVARLDEKQMTTPDAGGWSPKDNLAHLSEWMNSMMGYHVDKRPAHEVMRIPEEAAKGWDMEIINPILFERNRNRSSEDILNELRRVYDTVIAKLEAMSFEELMAPRRADDPEKRPLLLWVIGDTSDHFAEHRAVIERMF
jgi:hypothetical protein